MKNRLVLRPQLVSLCRLSFALVLGARLAPAAVVIHEVHFLPPEGDALEFVELHNSGPETVDLSGWAFTDGVNFVFPVGAEIPARGYAVVSRDREALQRRFSLSAAGLFGDVLSSLADDGERIALADAAGALVDELRYDSDAPWDAGALGRGPSLQRLCVDFDSRHPANWEAADPTPLAANRRTLCPPPLRAPRSVSIHEIYYNPLRDFEEETEFVELLNVSSEPVNLRGWAFTDGIDFRFEEDRVLGPGEILVVCRNQEALRAAFTIENTAGDYSGRLENEGERVTLVDADGRLADSVAWSDHGDWPVAADGLGFSLEKVVPAAPSDDPANWAASGESDLASWHSGGTTNLATSSKLIVYVVNTGEFHLDNVSIVDVDDPSVNLIPNGAFDAGVEGWELRGSHAGTRWEAGAGPDGSGAMRLVCEGRGAGASNGVSIDTATELSRDPAKRYRLSFDYRHLSGDTLLVARLSGSTVSRGIWWQLSGGLTASPGAPNGARRAAVPPFVDRLGREPRDPGSADPVFLTARVRGSDVVRVSLGLRVVGQAPQALEMHDDGASGDGAAGDGVWGLEVPPQPHSSLVTYTIEAFSASAGSRVFPARSDPTGSFGYYVNDNRPASQLPVYTVILNPERGLPPRAVIDTLNCGSYVEASFAVGGDLYHKAGIRRRGQSVCGDPDVIKRFLKFRFARGREFRGLRKLNLQSLWTDKALVREHLAWEAFGELGNPSCFQNHVRLHVNGQYFGLYAELEHPDQRFLARNGLNPDGNLYKAVASREERTGSTGSIQSSYEKKTNENGDFSDLAAFLANLHDTPPARLVEFFHERTDEDGIIDYQAGQVLTNNRDYPHKNHYLYHDTARGKWTCITWDMDLTYGKRWDGNFEGVLNDAMDNPGINPWYTTNVRSSGGGNELLDRFFSRAGTWYRRAYLTRLWDALHEKYTQEIVEAKLTALRGLLLEEQLEDIRVWGRSRPSANDPRAPADFDPNLDRVREHVRVRRAFLLDYLRRTEGFSGHPRLKVTELMYDPPDTQDGEFLELWNNSGAEVDVSGWKIEGLEGDAGGGAVEEFVFPPGSVIALDEVFVVAKSPLLFRARYGDGVRVFGPYRGNLSNTGEALRVKDGGPEFPATVDLVRYSSSVPWPVRAGGLGHSLELTDVSPDRDNDLSEHWRSSILLGGTPGEIDRAGEAPVLFSRGDCDADRRRSVADAVFLLRFLFLGADEPGCLDACDADGSRALDISDAAFFLADLFGRGRRPIPSPGPGECQPSLGGFCEASNCKP
jgi:hypothetical protein